MENKLDLEQFEGIRNLEVRSSLSIAAVAGPNYTRYGLTDQELAAINHLPRILAELKEARKEIEGLKACINAAKQHGSDALISVENDTGGPGCCQGIANMLAALEGWEGKE